MYKIVLGRETVSATTIAKALGLGEVQVRKDLNLVCGEGKPKIGYLTDNLISSIEKFLGADRPASAVIIGAGKLGSALQGYDGFKTYGLEIAAAFDTDADKTERHSEYAVYPMEQLASFCRTHDIRIGIITVPASSAQQVCDEMILSGITAIWNFAPCTLSFPENVTVRQENLALSLAHLKLSVK